MSLIIDAQFKSFFTNVKRGDDTTDILVDRDSFEIIMHAGTTWMEESIVFRCLFPMAVDLSESRLGPARPKLVDSESAGQF